MAYYKLHFEMTSIPFEARTDKEAVAKARRKLAAARRAGELTSDATLFYYGPGEREIWNGSMFYGGRPTYEQRHEIDLHEKATAMTGAERLEDLRSHWSDAAIVQGARMYTNRDETMDSILAWSDAMTDDFANRFWRGDFLIENR